MGNTDYVAVQVSLENTGAASWASATSSISAIVVSIGPGAVSSGLDLGGLLQMLGMGRYLLHNVRRNSAAQRSAHLGL